MLYDETLVSPDFIVHQDQETGSPQRHSEPKTINIYTCLLSFLGHFALC